jgi:membrane fusion protein (multidrug efflux system)
MKERRLRWLIISGVAFLAIAIGYSAYWELALRYEESTDDAYVNGNVVQITPQISGIVTSIGADDTEFVTKGETLVKIDQADAKVALDQVEAQLARTVREVRTLFSTTAQLQATVRVREADLATA